MNCQRVEQLLPLFVEGDLKNKQVASVSLHLAGCENCKLLAEDFKQSQQWLRSSLPLEFDEGFFDGLRNSVHREIQQQTTRVSWPLGLLSSYRFRFGLAAIAVVSVFIGLNLYFKPEPQNTVELVKQPVHQDTAKATYIEKSIATHNKHKPTLRSKRNRDVHKSKDQSVQPTIQDFQAAIEPQELSNAREQAGEVDEGPLQSDVAEAPEMLKIEFQTSDPNIRILWFTPKETIASKSDEETR